MEKFVEFFGPGMKALSVPDRATIANMSPEYGATMGFFPVDENTIRYMKLTNRKKQAAVVEACALALDLFYHGDCDAEYTDVVEIDLSTITPAVSGPARPQDRIPLPELKLRFAGIIGCEYKADTQLSNLSTFMHESGSNTQRGASCVPVSKRIFDLTLDGRPAKIGEGTLVIAAITSCTNTSNPKVLIGAALLARNAVKRGLRVPAHVKTSLAPGSKVVTRYLEDSGLTPYLEALGFHTAGYGCTTCIGNSGPLHPEIEKLIVEHDLNVAAVLSGNRNFEARIHQRIKSNFLASPMLVVAFAIAGRVDVDFGTEPVGIDPNGEPVYLDEIWPSPSEIEALENRHVKREFFADEYSRIFEGDEYWQELQVTQSTTYAWADDSTYIKNPPYFEGVSKTLPSAGDIVDARVLLVLGDAVTTDHISPAGAIAAAYPAGAYLISQKVPQADFNAYGARRGNHEVMMRGTFANIRIKNKMMAGKEGSFTRKFPENEEMYVYDAAMAYKKAGVPLLVLGGKEYGAGSSRDWAAKGPALLGVRAVIAQSFERIHRSNLVGMGILPLVFKEGQGTETLKIDGTESYTIKGLADISPRQAVTVHAQKPDGSVITFETIARLDTDVEVGYFKNGGILPYVWRKLAASA